MVEAVVCLVIDPKFLDSFLYVLTKLELTIEFIYLNILVNTFVDLHYSSQTSFMSKSLRKLYLLELHVCLESRLFHQYISKLFLEINLLTSLKQCIPIILY